MHDPTKASRADFGPDSPLNARAWLQRHLALSDTHGHDRIRRVKTNNQDVDAIPFEAVLRKSASRLRGFTNRSSDACDGEGINDTTSSHPIVWPNAGFACIDLKSVICVGRGHIGVDPLLGSYSPGNNHLDEFYGACCMSDQGCNSYYSVQKFWEGGNDFPLGMFVNAEDDNRRFNMPGNTQPSRVTHNWPKRMTTAHLEVYSADGAYGGLSLWADMHHMDNGGVYSKDLGSITFPNAAATHPEPDSTYKVAKLNGFVFLPGGGVPRPGRIALHMWGKTGARTSTGHDLGGFFSVTNDQYGYYNSGWLYPGKYSGVFIDTDTGKSKPVYISILRPFERIDFTLES